MVVFAFFLISKKIDAIVVIDTTFQMNRIFYVYVSSYFFWRIFNLIFEFGTIFERSAFSIMFSSIK